MLRSKLTYANVTATLALFVALGAGSATAARLITGADVEDNSLTGRDVRSLTGKDLRDGSLLAGDFRRGQLPRRMRLVARISPDGTSPSAEAANHAYCKPGERATGGGVVPASGVITADGPEHPPGVVVESSPLFGSESAKPIGWRGVARHEVNGVKAPQVWVVCASP